MTPLRSSDWDMFIELKKTFYFALLHNVHEKYYDYEKHINENTNYNIL